MDLPEPPTPKLERFRQTYRERGYVIARDLLPRALVDEVVDRIESEVVPFEGPLPRHPPDEEAEFASVANKFSKEGVLLNAIMNPQSLKVPDLAGFTEALGKLVTAKEISRLLTVLDGHSRRVLHQIILFFVCPETPAHIDSFGVDTWPRGGALTVRIPLEDIRSDAGPPFIHPTDELPSLDMEFGDDSPIWGHENPNHQAGVAYSLALEQHIEDLGEDPVVIEAGPGDVVFWSSLTVHGSMPVQKPETSRRAVQVLACPESIQVGSYLGGGPDWADRHRRILTQRGIRWRDRENQSS
jgi:phytanoyl-CoA hydroxylase